MPPTLIPQPASSTRRTVASHRHRENRVQQGLSDTRSRRKSRSRSPDARASVVEELPARSDSSRRKKKSSQSSAAAIVAALANGRPLTAHEETIVNRGRKSKTKSRSHSMYVDEEEAPPPPEVSRSKHKRKEKERSRSRETGHRSSRKTTEAELSDEDEPMYTGPLAQADYQRMKGELESMKQQMSHVKKTIGKQSKVIDELRIQLTSATKSHTEQREELVKLKARSKKSEELISSFETNLTCQICMEILLKPFGLNPCGHILCMPCLLGWFRAAPPGDDEMQDDEYQDALIYRKKTCPCCRAVVQSRPVPLYLVKSLASALERSKMPAGASRSSPPPEREDPWKGIFRDRYDDLGDFWSDEDGEDGEEDEEDGEDYDESDDGWSYGTDEDEERYHGPHVVPRWAPPNLRLTTEDYPFIDPNSDEMRMLRRGASLQMIELFSMSYSHDTGLSAFVDEENMVLLGWNIELHPEDATGEEYMDWIVTDMYDRPERWQVVEHQFDGTWTATRLVPAEEDEHYDDTDSEMWAEMDEDDDM